jgi:hypothetical protein
MSEPPCRVGVVKFWEKRTAGPIKAIHPASGKTITVNPQQDAMISSDLDKELRRLPALLSWYLSLRDRAETSFREARHNEHNTSETIYANLRENAKAKTTETELKMRVKADPAMRQAYRQRMEAEDTYQKLKSAVEAISEKRWSLQALVKNAALERGAKDSM